MQYKKIMTFFSVVLPLSVAVRFVQLKFTIETDTGFFKFGFEDIGNFMLALIFGFAIASAVFGAFTRRSPKSLPEGNVFMAVSALGYALSVAIVVLTESHSAVSVLAWQSALLRITGILSVVFFAAFGISIFLGFRIPNICTIIPVFYLILRIICDFSAISSLAMISDNLILMGAYCTGLWFMLQFAKLYNGVNPKNQEKRLLAGGLASVVLCFTQSLPHILINAFSEENYLHTSVSENLSVLFMGIFILTFIIVYFKREGYLSAH